ncbi:hypothetical protein BGZ63DRAFT_362580 [Mariannaea sp. PMI_226]|nr:hypothetical protein BGZ63DRAFT_362580 [Mariannaea sp. PMI_226]
MSHSPQAHESDARAATETRLLTAVPSIGSTNLSDSGQNSPFFSSDFDQRNLETDSEVFETPAPQNGGSFAIDYSISDADLPLSSTLRVELPESSLLTPKSCFQPFEPGAPMVSEAEAVRRLAWLAKQAGQDDGFIEFQLDEFAIYCDKPDYPEEMRSLHQLDARQGMGDFFFDGKLSVGNTTFFVKRVTIAALPIGNYGTLKEHAVRHKIWLRSSLNGNREIYYRLRKPADEYRRFFNPFLWVADLTKHFVDFLGAMGNNNRKVDILCFRTTFNTWLSKAHKRDPEFIAWRSQFPRNDFRSSVVANISFLYKEAIGVLGHNKAYSHTIWSEVWDFTRYKPYVGKLVNDENPPTVVTQYIYDCFSHLPFGDRLEAVALSKETQSLRKKLIHTRSLDSPTICATASRQIGDIKCGDTISTQRDDIESGTQWRRDISHSCDDIDKWFALVQRVHTDHRGRRSFDVIWYYRPVDTLCGLMKYPWNNELFLSDHCSCSENSKISEDEVLGVHDIAFGYPSTTRMAEFFCRQTYFHAERKWVTLDEKHMCCKHVKKKKKQSRTGSEYRPGDTLLVVLDNSSGRSEPCELLESYEEKNKTIFRFRWLLRRNQVDTPNSRPNELVYSNRLIEVTKRRIREPCFVRFFTADQEIPTPYDRDGVGGFFYITHMEDADADRFRPLEKPFPTSLRQGYDPTEEVIKLRGLDLFCGGGNFGRGLEDGGGIEMKWANDYDAKAIHTYMANVSSAEAVAPFLGSVDDLQRLAMKGHFSHNVPRISDVDFISGGSPCPGFSHLTNDKTTITQRKNQSLVAAFGSFIDLYRPQYGLLENVPGIVQKKANRDQDVFSQLICAVVGLGYQTQCFFLDASSCGSPQRRSRVFLAFASPGLQLPRPPAPTHAHPPKTRSLSLGHLPTGEPMAERAMPDATPFDFVSASTATADLPPVYDSKPDICVPFPDHRIAIGVTKPLRLAINHIPTHPWGMNFAQSWYGLDRQAPGSGVLTPAERLFFPVESKSSLSRTVANSNAYGRQMPNRLFETIVTRPGPSDAKNGRALHWREARPITVMEARRAQGFRDDDVLLGPSHNQIRIVGNSVAREPAVALGAVFREAWVQSLSRERFGHGVVAPDTGSSVAIPAEGFAIPSDSDLDSQISERSLSYSSFDSKDDVGLPASDQSPTVSTTPDSTTAPPPSPPSLSKGIKRPTSSISLEIRVSKSLRTDDSKSFGRTTTRHPSVHQEVVVPSPLRQSVTLQDND